MAITLNMNNYKSAGIYTLEIDETATSVVEQNALRLLVGFANKGIFNRPVYLANDTQRDKIFGPINTKLEHKGCFFNRFAQTMLKVTPILALNLLKVDDSEKGPDQVNFASLSLDAGTPNPTPLSAGTAHGEYDYLCGSIDNVVYGTDEEGDVIPFVGKTPYASLYDRSKFWIPSPENLMAVAANKLQTGDEGTFEHTNLLNFANVGTEEFSLLVYKTEGLTGWDVTASEWYGGAENIPFGWVRPTDYISDYFINVICVKGNWSDFPHLSTDVVWSSYFTTSGIDKSKINSFLGADGVELIGSWTGCIIPDLVDKQGTPQNIFNKINNSIESTGLMASFNEDAAEVLSYDYNGTDNDVDTGSGCWFYDIDGDRQIETSQGESVASAYMVDMVGHNFQAGFKDDVDDEMSENNSYENESINPEKLASFKGVVETYYLKSASELSSAGFEAVEGTLTYNGNSLKYGIADVAQGNIIFNFDESMANEAVTVKITKKNRLDIEECTGPIAADGKLEIASLAVAKPAGLAKTSPFAEGDIVAVSINGVAKPVSYTVPALDNRSETFGASYGQYLVIAKNADGTINRSDVYRLYAKAVTKGSKTTYADTFEKFVADIEIDIVSAADGCDAYKIVYPMSANRVVYELHAANDIHPNGKVYYRTGNGGAKRLYGVNFLSYAKLLNKSDVVSNILGVHYFADAAEGSAKPVAADNKSVFIITDEASAKNVKVGDLVNNIAFENEIGVSQKYNLIPGLTRVTGKVFVTVSTGTNKFTYKGSEYEYNSKLDMIRNASVGTQGFYLITTIDPVKIYEDIDVESLFVTIGGNKWYPRISEADRFANGGDGARITNAEGLEIAGWEDSVGVDIETYIANEVGGVTEDTIAELNALGQYANIVDDIVYAVTKQSVIKRQLPLSDSSFSSSLRFIPLKGLSISSRHKPGYDADGNIDIEGGIEKIYSVLTETGMLRGLKNPEMANYRYIVDSFSYGLDAGLGGKSHVSYVAKQRSKCTALLNMPSQKQFAASSNPVFCDSYVAGTTVKPAFDTSYIPTGGNSEMYATKVFSLPSEDDGSKYAAAFWPNLIYTVNGKKISVPPAADVSNSFIRKYLGGDPYMIVANLNGIISNSLVTGVEYKVDQEDRDALEPMGVDCIISRNGDIMIYGNQTCYQKLKSDFNKLHVREILNTVEINCENELQKFNFLYNTPVTRAAAVTAVTPILSAMVNAGALQSYTIQCDDDNNGKEIIDNSAMLMEIGVMINMGMEKIMVPITLRKRSDA